MKLHFKYRRIVFSLLALISICLGQDESAETSIVNNQIQQLVKNLLINLPNENIGVAVLSFETTEGRTEARDLGEAAAILINENLINIPNISVVERQKLQEIVKEIGLSQSGLTNNEIEVGNLLNVNYLIAGAVADLGSRFLLAARLIDVEKGNIIQSASVEIPSNSFLSISSELVVIKKYPITAAFRSMIFPGWGQFYNDKPRKGSIILTTELVLAASTIGSFVLYKQSKGHYDRATDRNTATNYFNEMEKHSQMNWVSLGALSGVWFYAIIDSYLDAKNQIQKVQNIK